MRIFIGTFAIQLPAGPVPEEKETGKILIATAATCDIEASSKVQEESSKERKGLKRKGSKPNPKRGTGLCITADDFYVAVLS